MSNYPDGLSEGTPGAPWNQEPERCSKCRDDLDQDASEQGGDEPGWPGGICSDCADQGAIETGCSCDEGGFCSPWHRDEYEEEGRRIEEEVRNNPATHVTAADKLAASDPVLFHRLCEDNPERLP
jgi:hypothetical protein